MKSFEIKGLGLEEMSVNEMMTANGGGWGKIAIRIGKWIGGVIATWYAERGLEAACAANDDEEDIYDAVYDGGTLDPAYCYADR